jgi:hypothetical protein
LHRSVVIMSLRYPVRAFLIPLLAAAACGTDPGGGDGDDDGVDLGPDVADTGCSPIFRQGVLPTWEITISDEEWAKMEDEFLHVVERTAMMLDPEPYHPVQARFDDGVNPPVEVPNTLLRLKGASSWLQTIMLDAKPKMQFVLAFNEVDPQGRFEGVRKVELDMPRTDTTFIRQRLALHYLRSAGTYAQCANSARVVINGQYYGLYTHLERMDKELLQRYFGNGTEDEGDLWKGGRTIKTNEDTFSWDRIDAFWHNITTPAELDAMADMDASLYEWAAEAVIGAADGYYNGRANFYLYDHPTRGFIWFPHDMDTAFADDFLPEEADPLFPSCIGRWEKDWRHYLLTVNEPAWQERYIAALVEARSIYDAGLYEEKVDAWRAQIARAAEEDPHRPFPMDMHDFSMSQTREFVRERPEFLDSWLACRSSGGADADGDGFAWCRECDDTDAAVKPGAQEVCDLRDNDCDGRVDDVGPDTMCP